MNSVEKRILVAVDDLSSDMVDFASRLVAQPSTQGNEASVLKVMEQEMTAMNLTPQKVAIDPQALANHPGFAPTGLDYEDRYNLVAERSPDGQGGQSLLFNGHLDVVSPAPLKYWDRDPFQPLVKDGWLYGRGAGDMKGGVAAMTYAIKAIEKAGLGLAAPVTLEAVIEEECTGNGALACVLAGYDADAVLIPEPTGPSILTAQVGVCWFKVTLDGMAIHVQDTEAGVNAIEKSYALIKALRQLEDELNEVPHIAYKEHFHPINLNVGIISGGDWPSTVPAAAEFHCRLGFFPDMSYEEICSKVKDTVARAVAQDPWLTKNPPTVEFYGFRSLGHFIPFDQPAFKLIDELNIELVGKPVEENRYTATTDVRAFVHYGKGQATCIGPLAENIHAVNERLDISSMIHTAKIYALFMSRWCKVVE